MNCPAEFTRNPEVGTNSCVRVCPTETYVSDDGMSCLTDKEKCTIWEMVDNKGKCQRCEQKKNVTQLAQQALLKAAQETPVKVVLKDAKQSSTWPSKHRGMMLEAANAIDDNADSFAHTRMGRGHWWKANFTGGSRIVKKVVITNRRDCCGDRLKNTQVFIGKNWCGNLPAYT